MTLTQFVKVNGLRQADAIVLRKKIMGMVDHYAIYLGFRNGAPVFVANYKDGVKEVCHKEMKVVLQSYQPKDIEPFPGDDDERKHAVKRAISRIGERAYNYIHNNCEHFKNWVHYSENRSEQVKKAGNIAIGSSLVIGAAAIASKNGKAGCVALGLLLLGILAREAAND